MRLEGIRGVSSSNDCDSRYSFYTSMYNEFPNRKTMKERQKVRENERIVETWYNSDRQ